MQYYKDPNESESVDDSMNKSFYLSLSDLFLGETETWLSRIYNVKFSRSLEPLSLGLQRQGIVSRLVYGHCGGILKETSQNLLVALVLLLILSWESN